MMEAHPVNELCKIRDLYRSISEFEIWFQQMFGIGLNEGMLLCSLCAHKYSSSELAVALGLTNSNASKVIKSAEKKGLVKRIIGKEDKRQMYFTLTEAGKSKLESVKCADFVLPELLAKLLQQ